MFAIRGNNFPRKCVKFTVRAVKNWRLVICCRDTKRRINRTPCVQARFVCHILDQHSRQCQELEDITCWSAKVRLHTDYLMILMFPVSLCSTLGRVKQRGLTDRTVCLRFASDWQRAVACDRPGCQSWVELLTTQLPSADQGAKATASAASHRCKAGPHLWCSPMIAVVELGGRNGTRKLCWK